MAETQTETITRLYTSYNNVQMPIHKLQKMELEDNRNKYKTQNYLIWHYTSTELQYNGHNYYNVRLTNVQTIRTELLGFVLATTHARRNRQPLGLGSGTPSGPAFFAYKWRAQTETHGAGTLWEGDF